MLDLNRIDEAVRGEGGVTRRLLLAYGAALAAVPTLGLRADDRPKGAPKARPFTLGVASGDPDHDSVVIWTRLAPKPLQPDGGMPHADAEVEWVVANDEKMRDVVHKGTAAATPELGHSVHVVVGGLRPDRWYWYQFRCAGFESPAGRTRTLPEPEATPSRLRLAFASCQHFEEGLFTAYEHMAKDDPDLVFHLGDYIYEGGARKGRVRLHEGDKECRSLADYRVRHCQYRHDPHLHAMHARCPWVVTWDDHDVENNYAGETSSRKGVKAADFLRQRAHAYQAYYEMMPLRPPKPDGPHLRLYRGLTFGRLASFQVLDTRQYRTAQPNGGEYGEINAAALDAKGTMIGGRQREWLEGRLVKSDATWSVIAQQVMMGMVDHHGDRRYSMDAWPGYAHERVELVKFLAERRVRNPVVLSGDVHSNWVNELRPDDRRQDGPPVAAEFVGTSISSKGNGAEVPAARLAKLQAVNPFVKFHDDQRGYVRCEVTAKEWRGEFRVVSDVTKPGGKASTAGVFVVTAGRPGVNRA